MSSILSGLNYCHLLALVMVKSCFYQDSFQLLQFLCPSYPLNIFCIAHDLLLNVSLILNYHNRLLTYEALAMAYNEKVFCFQLFQNHMLSLFTLCFLFVASTKYHSVNFLGRCSLPKKVLTCINSLLPSSGEMKNCNMLASWPPIIPSKWEATDQVISVQRPHSALGLDFRHPCRTAGGVKCTFLPCYFSQYMLSLWTLGSLVFRALGNLHYALCITQIEYNNIISHINSKRLSLLY